jgi:serine/threonine protein kinase
MRYELLRRLARGGMADVYEGVLRGALGFERRVAIKKILPQWSYNSEFETMLVDEAKLVVGLNHPNIVQVFELVREGRDLYLVMEFVEGIDLKSLLQVHKRLPWDVIPYLVEQIAQGLAYAHQGTDAWGKPLCLVHRDVSPQNVLLAWQGQIKLADFGIAKAMGRQTETATGLLKGKFAYMAPEQARGEEIDARSDQFSFGVLIYEMILGRKPFGQWNDLQTLEAIKNKPVDWTVDFEIPIVWKSWMEKFLSKNPDERFEGLDSFLNEFHAVYSAAAMQASRLAWKNLMLDFKLNHHKNPEPPLLPKPDPVVESADTLLVAEETEIAASTMIATAIHSFPSTKPPLEFIRESKETEPLERVQKSVPRASGNLLWLILLSLLGMGSLGFLVWIVAPDQAIEASETAQRSIVASATSPDPDNQEEHAEVQTAELTSQVSAKTEIVDHANNRPAIVRIDPDTDGSIPKNADLNEVRIPKIPVEVRVRPYAQVVVDGIRQNDEKSVWHLRLSSGSHEIILDHVPTGQIIKRTVMVPESGRLVCRARMDLKESWQCTEQSQIQ